VNQPQCRYCNSSLKKDEESENYTLRKLSRAGSSFYPSWAPNMAIYTRTGDKGKTSLFNGQRISKDSSRIEAVGTVDELNSIIGVALAEIQNSKVKSQNYKLKLKIELEKIQNDLFNIGSNLANPKLILNSQLSTLNSRVKDFERFIDRMTQNLPPLKNFILPGGGKAGSMLHLARAVCRRAERRVVALSNLGYVDKNMLIYLNRLSDLLFTMARFSNFREKKKETIWSKER